VLRDTQNYSIAMESGLGISALNPGMTSADREHWKPVLEWLKREMPVKKQRELDLSPRSNWPSAVA
jgi:hypothetical protein